jgi:hypothetical protein
MSSIETLATVERHFAGPTSEAQAGREHQARAAHALKGMQGPTSSQNYTTGGST